MIRLEYKKPNLYVIPDSESRTLVDRLFMSCKWATEKGGVYEIQRMRLDDLSEALAPYKNDLEMAQDFRDFAASYRETNTESAPGKFGVIKIDAYINHSIIKTKNYPFEQIDRPISYFFKPAKNSKKYQEGKWDGVIHLFDEKTNSFPTGLLFIVKESLVKAGYGYKIVYKYNRAPERKFDWYVDDGIIPDPDQLEAIDLAFAAKRSVVKAPTGFGKTVLLAKRLTARFGVQTLFVANKKALLDDARDEFLKGTVGLRPEDVGEIKDGIFGHTKLKSTTLKEDIPDLDMPIIVATIQSLDAKLKDPRTSDKIKKWLKSVEFTMVDETQSLNDKTWAYVFSHIYSPYRVCLSATPRRTDGATLLINAFSGDVSFWTTAETQIEKGRLSELEFISSVFDHQLYNEDDDKVEYHIAYAEWIVANDNRNRKIVEHTRALVDEGRHTLVLIQFIEHGEILLDMLIRSGIKEYEIRFIYGETKDKVRKKAIEEFRKGDFKILIGSTIFDAGVNIPIISGIVLAGAGNSDVTLVQRIGRSVRNADYEDILGYIPEFMQNNDGDKKAKVIDIADVNVKFFTRQSYNRLRTAKAEFGASRVFREGIVSRPIAQKDAKVTSANKDVTEKLNNLKASFADRFKITPDENNPDAAVSMSIADILKGLKK